MARSKIGPPTFGFGKLSEIIGKIKQKEIYRSILGDVPELTLEKIHEMRDIIINFLQQYSRESFVTKFNNCRPYAALRETKRITIPKRSCKKIYCPWCHVRSCLFLLHEIEKVLKRTPKIRQYVATSFEPVEIPVFNDYNKNNKVLVERTISNVVSRAKSSVNRIWNENKDLLHGTISWSQYYVYIQRFGLYNGTILSAKLKNGTRIASKLENEGWRVQRLTSGNYEDLISTVAKSFPFPWQFVNNAIYPQRQPNISVLVKGLWCTQFGQMPKLFCKCGWFRGG